MSTEQDDAPRVVSASREIAASPERIFALIADPAEQPRWDANDNLAEAAAGQRVRRVGDVFTTTLTTGSVRENHVVEFEEGRRIVWDPSEVGRRRPGHRWSWELVPLGDDRTLVTHTYDWSLLTDGKRLKRARATTPDRLRASIDRLAALAESTGLPRAPVRRRPVKPIFRPRGYWSSGSDGPDRPAPTGRITPDDRGSAAVPPVRPARRPEEGAGR